MSRDVALINRMPGTDWCQPMGTYVLERTDSCMWLMGPRNYLFLPNLLCIASAVALGPIEAHI
jgi:hypothetical protein